jgi:predicted outer membrane protein
MNLPRNSFTSPAPCQLFAAAALLALLAGCNHDNTTAQTTSSSASTMNTGSGASGPTTANDSNPTASANVGASSASGSDPRYVGSGDTSGNGTVSTAGAANGTSSNGTTVNSSASGTYATTSGTASSAPTSSSGMSSDTNSGSSSYDTSQSGKSHHDGHAFWRKGRIASRREMAYSELAVTQASNPEVRSFAQQLVDEHRRMQAEFASMGDNDGDMNARHSRMSTGDTSMTGTTSATGGTAGGVNSASGASESGITAGGDNSKEVHPIANGGPDSGRYPADGSGRSAYGPNSANGMGGSPSTSSEPNTPTSMNSDDRMADNRNWDRDAWMKNDHDYSQLSGKSGAEFDKAYLDLVIDSEKDAVAACEKKVDMKDDHDGRIQRFANDHLAMHRQRLDEARTLRNKLS